MMHKTKSAKFSLAIKIASILTCVSVMAVGFASWLILKPATDAKQNGAFTVYTVEESQLSFAITNFDGAVTFGKPSNSDTTMKWLKPSTNVAVEDLTASFTLTITSSNSEVALKEYANYAYVRFTPSSTFVDEFETALTNKVITFSAAGSATGVTINNANYDPASDYATLAIPLSGVAETSLTVTVNFNFGWGEHFKHNDTIVNPYDFYNANGYSADSASDASTYLGYIAALKDGKYNVAVSLDAEAVAPDPAN